METALLGCLKRQDLRGCYLAVDDLSEDGHGYSLFGRIRQYNDAGKADRGVQHEVKPTSEGVVWLSRCKVSMRKQPDKASGEITAMRRDMAL